MSYQGKIMSGRIAARLAWVIGFMFMCGNALAGNVSGTVSYSFAGMSGVIPFSGAEGKEITVIHPLNSAPYVLETKQEEGSFNTLKQPDNFQDGALIKMIFKRADKRHVMVRFNIELKRHESKITHVSVDGRSSPIETKKLKEIGTMGAKKIESGVRSTILDIDKPSKLGVHLVVF